MSRRAPLQGVPHGISDGLSRLLSGVKERLETIAGERGEKLDLTGLERLTISNPPTQAQVEYIRTQLIAVMRLLQG